MPVGMNWRQLKVTRVLVLGISLLLISAGNTEILRSEDSETGLKSWKWSREGISLQLVQRLPDQTRGFFQARGFTAEEADLIAGSCVFQSIFRNDGSQLLSYNLDHWKVIHQGVELPLQTAERWAQKWQDGAVTQAARIALRWSLLPTRQEYRPGDYNWGMTSYGVAPGEQFDLSIVVNLDGARQIARINGIECARDR